MRFTFTITVDGSFQDAARVEEMLGEMQLRFEYWDRPEALECAREAALVCEEESSLCWDVRMEGN